jgi:YaiO family outer membrane protein
MLLSLLLTAALAQTPAPSHDEAVRLAQSGDYTQALSAFQQIAAANPNDHRARLWIAQLHVWMGHPDRAEAVYRSVMLEDPMNVEAMLGVATALLAREEPEEAVEILERAEQLAPDNPDLLAALGRAHRQAGNITRSLGYLQRAVVIAPSETNRLSLERTRMIYDHRVEVSSFFEEFSDSQPDGYRTDLGVNVRLNDRWRVFGRGQLQRRSGRSEEGGGGGAEWRWKPRTTLAGHFFIGPDNVVLPQRDGLAEMTYSYGQADWSGSYRYFDFQGAQAYTFSPAVTWWWNDRLNVGMRYSVVLTDFAPPLDDDTSVSVLLRGSYEVYPRVWANLGYAHGIENFDTLSRDRLGDFDANTFSAGARVDLRTLTGIFGLYEHQWRPDETRMHRFTFGLAQRF